jgi:hypothetical protein
MFSVTEIVAWCSTPWRRCNIRTTAAREALHDRGVGLTLVGDSPQEFAAYVKSETDKCREAGGHQAVLSP